MKSLIIFLMVSLVTVKAADFSFEKAWIKAVPPSLKISAMFGVIKNNTDKDIRLMSVRGDIAKNIEIHNHIKTNGVMKMRKIPFLMIPAKGEIELKPMHEHIMFIGLKKQLEIGSTHKMILIFEKGEKLEVDVKVKKMSDEHSVHNHHH